jgi:hypothetical protein
LRVNCRQFKCEKCQKPFSESLDNVGKNRNYTKRLARRIIEEVLDSNIRSVARRNGLSEEVQTMLKDVAQELLIEKPSQLRRLGMDEIALVKGQGNSCAVNVRLRKALYMPEVVAMRCNPLLKALTERLLGRGHGQNAGDWCFDEEVGAFGFWYFKVPKAFRSNLFARYPLTDQDSIYKNRGRSTGHDITLTSLSAFSAFSAVQKSNPIPQQNCFSPKTTPQQFPPEKLKTMLQLIAFECPVHETMDKLANSDKMTDVVVSD